MCTHCTGWLLALRDNSQQVDKIPTNPPTGTGYTYELGTRHQPTPAHSEHSREEVKKTLDDGKKKLCSSLFVGREMSDLFMF